ncbi:hypothetical protein DFA_03038 [Cavenderia fasciculata]|uniref:RING-type domain-containing protein n=1 Tax=Cavenderia fasciculata TaxID=261658 RepID=F4PGG0_CACFS|nr:uncharacterized protein DFA_03038 [Cavenderia fasciculata]EGG24794.1 hypothetical protein DFA_03038 [Cavenderia fasciculata]|eukprot:XP_004362645.1 hypothetical protein DFA_03038 [Cavenderia fasciculata]
MGANKSKAKNINELQSDIQHSNELLKTIKDKSGYIIQLKLDSTSGGVDLLKDVQLWKFSSSNSSTSTSSTGNSGKNTDTTPLSVLKYNQYYHFRGQVVEFLETSNSGQPTVFETKTKGGDIDYDEDEYDHECPVCLENEATCVAPCMHKFCNQCINQWRTKQKSCPICISPFSDDLDFELIDAPKEEELLHFFKTMVLKK